MLRYDRQLHTEVYATVRTPPYWRRQQRALVSLVKPDDTVLLVHHGFSKLLPNLKNVMSTDPLPLIEPSDDLPSHPNEFRYWDWVITDDVIQTLASVSFPDEEPSELTLFVQTCEAISGNTIHFVNSGISHPQFRDRSLEQWSDFAPHHYWADSYTWEVRGKL